MDAVVLTCFDIFMLHDPHRLVSELWIQSQRLWLQANFKFDSVRGPDVSLLCSNVSLLSPMQNKTLSVKAQQTEIKNLDNSI